MNIDKAIEKAKKHIPGIQDSRVECAVLVALNRRGDSWEILYETRAMHIEHQPGEVCFPGGKMEGNETAAQCAIRETWEELGIPASAIEVIAELDYPMHSRGFPVYPILAKVTGKGTHWDHINADEVAETFQVPVSFFEQNPPLVWNFPSVSQLPEDFPYELLHISRDYPWTRKGEVAAYIYEGYPIWGLTARIVRNIFGHY